MTEDRCATRTRCKQSSFARIVLHGPVSFQFLCGNVTLTYQITQMQNQVTPLGGCQRTR